MTRLYNHATMLDKYAALFYAYKGYRLRYTAAIKSLVWGRGGK